MKNYKPQKNDEITVEMFENVENNEMQAQKLFNKTQREENFSKDQKMCMIVQIHKEVDTKDCSKYGKIKIAQYSVESVWEN